MNIKETIRTMLVDDHAVVRSGYRTYLEAIPGFTVVAEAETADEAVSRYRRLFPDVVIMDIMLRGASGIDASRRIIAIHPGAKILVFSMYDSPVLLQQALDVGVLGAVGKECDPATLREAAVAVSRGERYLEEAVAESLEFANCTDSENLLRTLTPREFEVFMQLVSGSSGAETADALSLASKTVANLASLVRQKLGVTSDVQLVKLAADAGIVSWIRHSV